MPKYVYFCKACKTDFEIKHSLKEVHKKCENCGEEGSLDRKPSDIFLSKKPSNIEGKSRAGDVVREAIEEARLDLKDDQTSLKNREYKK